MYNCLQISKLDVLFEALFNLHPKKPKSTLSYSIADVVSECDFKWDIAYHWQRKSVLTDGNTLVDAEFVDGTAVQKHQGSQEVCEGELHQEVHLGPKHTSCAI